MASYSAFLEETQEIESSVVEEQFLEIPRFSSPVDANGFPLSLSDQELIKSPPASMQTPPISPSRSPIQRDAAVTADDNYISRLQFPDSQETEEPEDEIVEDDRIAYLESTQDYHSAFGEDWHRLLEAHPDFARWYGLQQPSDASGSQPAAFLASSSLPPSSLLQDNVYPLLLTVTRKTRRERLYQKKAAEIAAEIATLDRLRARLVRQRRQALRKSRGEN